MISTYDLVYRHPVSSFRGYHLPVMPDTKETFDKCRPFQCEAQNLLHRISGYEEIRYSSTEAPCYVCGRTVHREKNIKIELFISGDFYDIAHIRASCLGGSNGVHNLTITCCRCILATGTGLPLLSVFEGSKIRKGIDPAKSIAYSHNIRTEEQAYHDYYDNHRSYLDFLLGKLPDQQGYCIIS